MSVAAIIDRNYHIFIAQPTILASRVQIIEVMNLDLAKTTINNNIIAATATSKQHHQHVAT